VNAHPATTGPTSDRKDRMTALDLTFARKGAAIVATLVILTTMALGASIAQAEPKIELFSTSSTTNQAGAHADVTTTLSLKTLSPTSPKPDGIPQSIDLNLPPGVIGTPASYPTCTQEAAAITGQQAMLNCPATSIVGSVEAIHSLSAPGLPLHGYLYNIVPPPGAPGTVAIAVNGAPLVPININPRTTSDFGLEALTPEIPTESPISFVKVTIWGDPAAHDRGGGCIIPEGSASNCLIGPIPFVPALPLAQQKSFMRNPTVCDGPKPIKLDLTYYENLDQHYKAESTEPTPTGCSAVPFTPSIDAQPTSQVAGGASGLDFTLNVPQSENPNGIATSDLRTAHVTLPEGISVNSGAADGLASCSPQEIGLTSTSPIHFDNEDPACPDASKIGTAEVETPLLADPLQGTVYLAKQNDNPFNSLLAMYVVLQGHGITVKLAGKVTLDPATGQISTTFEETPQLPFSSFHLHLKGGSRGVLAMPPTCGTEAARAELTPWSNDSPVIVKSSFAINQGCDRATQFTPSFDAGVTGATAGAPSTFAMNVGRESGQQNLSQIDVSLPHGQLAKLAGVPLCADAAAATGACPSGSRIGSTTVAVGAGGSSLWVPQAGKEPTAVYLAGPYKGDPYSLVVKVPAQAGPFDLGTVAVRSGIAIDPQTTQVTVSSDPLPQILQGIRIEYQKVHVEIDRPGFVQNPTNCNPSTVGAEIKGAQIGGPLTVDAAGVGISAAAGLTAHRSSPYQVSGCAALGFEPKIGLKLVGGTKRNDYPSLQATVTARAGDANIGNVSVALPHSEFLAQNHINTVCTRPQFAADGCPEGSIYGYAKAFSPLLDQPLEGPVYLKSSSHRLPDLVAALHGQVDVDLEGRIDSVKGGIRSTFEAVPDAPVSKFELIMKGGSKSLLVNSRDLCRAPHRATVRFEGQNGRHANQFPVLKAQCGKQGKAKKHPRLKR